MYEPHGCRGLRDPASFARLWAAAVRLQHFWRCKLYQLRRSWAALAAADAATQEKWRRGLVASDDRATQTMSGGMGRLLVTSDATTQAGVEPLRAERDGGFPADAGGERKRPRLQQANARPEPGVMAWQVSTASALPTTAEVDRILSSIRRSRRERRVARPPNPPEVPCGRPSQSCADGGAELDSCSASHILAGAQRNAVCSGRRLRLTRRSGRLPRSRARGAAFRSCSRPASRTSAVAATSRGTPTTMTPLKTFKCSFPFRNISIPGSEPSVARELRSNSFPHFSFSSAQLHDVWLGGASVLGSHLAGEPSAGAYVFALRGRLTALYELFTSREFMYSV